MKAIAASIELILVVGHAMKNMVDFGKNGHQVGAGTS